MSEPVIKAVLWRCACDRRPCLGLQMCRKTPSTPLYGPDALVRVALAVINAPWRFSGETNVAAATRVVDRLTKGDV